MGPALKGSRETGSAESILRFFHVTKRFGGTTALDDASLEVRAGEVMGLLGQNGSGKSTLIRILAGYHAPEEGGELEIGGRPVRLPLRPGEFRALGMAFVHQDAALLPALTVTENLRIGALSRRTLGAVNWRREAAHVALLLEEFGIDCDPFERVERLRPWQRPLLAIVRAVDEVRRLMREGGVRHGLLILDEPTSGVGDVGVGRLFDVMRRVKEGGFGILFVSHDLDEVLAITDRVTVLRDGRVAGSGSTREIGKEALIEMIVGRPLSAVSPAPRESAAGSDAVRVTALTGPGVRGASFRVAAGEILGLTGLTGSGFAEVGALIAGALRASSGDLRLDREPHALAAMTPRKAIAAGLAYVPSDRLRAGCVGELTIAENLALPVLDRLVERGALKPSVLARHGGALCRRFEVRPAEPALRFEALSGGNQQKTVLAKWLQLAPRLLILEEPTQGVDVGSREQIFAAIRHWAAEGAAVLCASSDHGELARLCGRVLIFRQGKIAAELGGSDVSLERMAYESFGSAAAIAG